MVMVERVVEVSPDVGIGINMVLVQVLVHVNVGEHVLQLGVVVVRHRSEGVEEIRIDLFSSRNHIKFFLLIIFSSHGHVRLHAKDVSQNQTRVDSQMSGIVYSSQEAKQVWSVNHFCFI